jgi:serpin B
VFLANFETDPEAARNAINRWVSDQTEQLIPELLMRGDITKNTRLVLTNTVYLHASWEVNFDPHDTQTAPFTKLDGSLVPASMMHARRPLPYAAGVSRFRSIPPFC